MKKRNNQRISTLFTAGLAGVPPVDEVPPGICDDTGVVEIPEAETFCGWLNEVVITGTAAGGWATTNL